MIIVPSNVSTSFKNRFFKSFAVGVDPEHGAVLANGSKVYIGNVDAFTGSVSVVDTGSDSVVATVSLAGVRSLCSSSDSSKVYAAAYYNNRISVIDAASNSVSATISLGAAPRSLTITSSGVLYSANYQNNVSVVNTATNSIVQTISLPGSGGVSCLLPDDSKLYLISGTSNVCVVDTSTGSIAKTISFGGESVGAICVNQDGSSVCVATTSAGANSGVHVIDTASDTLISKIDHPYTCTSIAFGPDGYLYFTDDAGRFGFFDVSTGSLLAWDFIRVGYGNSYGGSGIVFAPSLSKCYVMSKIPDLAFAYSLV